LNHKRLISPQYLHYLDKELFLLLFNVIKENTYINNNAHAKADRIGKEMLREALIGFILRKPRDMFP
jgi:hypothetical protein